MQGLLSLGTPAFLIVDMISPSVPDEEQHLTLMCTPTL